MFTFSMHQQHNYPTWKPPARWTSVWPTAPETHAFSVSWRTRSTRVAASEPDVVYYLAGADPYEDDQLGGLRLTKDGLRRRDRLVIDMCRTLRVPLVITLAGGYARQVDDTVSIHVATVEEACAALVRE